MKNRAAYTVLFVLFLSVLCTLLLTASHQMLNPRIVRNRELAHKRSVLFASGHIDLPEQQGLIQSMLQAVGLMEERKQRIPDDVVEILYDLYVVKTDDGKYEIYQPGGYGGRQLAGYAHDFEFTGYKGKVRGVVSFDTTKKYLLGVGIYDQRETAGKGALVANVSWLKKFRGVSVREGYLMLKKVKDGPNVVACDGLSKASITFRKLEDSLNRSVAIVQGGKNTQMLDIKRIIVDAVGIASPDGWPPHKPRPVTLRHEDYRRPKYMLPEDFRNIALNKQVTTNVEGECIKHNDLSVVTDGILNSKKGFVGLMNYGETPYVQIDLGKQSTIYCIGLWQCFAGFAYSDLIVQIADNAEFAENVRTLFNNDYDNSVKLSNLDRKPIDWLFISTKFGELIPEKEKLKPDGFKARYIRVYSGIDLISETEARFVEIKVWGMQ